MSLLTLLRKRRSVRRFLNNPVPQRTQARLKEACLRAPSGNDIQPWTFYFVENPTLRATLSKLKPQHAGFLRQAPLCVVISASDKGCDTWIEDCSIATILLQMAATDAGLGSCWVQVHKRRRADGSSSEEYVREAVGIPVGHRVLCVVALGYPALEPKTNPAEKLLWDRIWRM